MADTESGAKATLEKLRAAFASVEWLEIGQPFWTAKVHFGERDSATIVVVSGGLLTQVLAQVAAIEGLRTQLTSVEEPGQFADALAQLLDDADITLWNEIVEPLFTTCVVSLEAPELAGILRRGIVLPDADAPVADRIEFVRSLPVVLVGRVLIGIGVQAGNLLTRSTRS
jgi:hypothetical protein